MLKRELAKMVEVTALFKQQGLQPDYICLSYICFSRCFFSQSVNKQFIHPVMINNVHIQRSRDLAVTN